MKLLKKIEWGLLLSAVALSVSGQAQPMEDSVRERLYAAAAVGDVAELKRLASLGYSLELTDSSGNTAFCQAVWSQNKVAVSALLKAGANGRPSCLKRIPYVTETRIYAAAHAEDLDQLVAWKKEGLNVDVVDPKTGNSALCEAVYNYDCPAIQTLLRSGSQQAQPCMRRIPQEVRDNLQCRPIVIDWQTIGYTVLGLGMAGALVAVLGSGGGNGSTVCPPDQRWNGDRCVSCDTCWKGNTCVTKEVMRDNFYYRDEKTADCWVVSPPPVNIEGEALKEAVEKIEDDPRYKAGRYQSMINAAEAYARGYSGYMVERTSPYGRLVNGQVAPGKTPTLSDKKVTVAIYSDGMNIGYGAGATKNVSDPSATAATTTREVQVWDFGKVNKAFYNSKDPDLGSEWSMHDANTDKVVSDRVAELGQVDTNLALNSVQQPYGFNFDYGPCAADEEHPKNCYGGKVVKVNYGEENDPSYVYHGLAVWYDAGGTPNYLLTSAETSMIIGATPDTPTSKETVKRYARWHGLKTDDEEGHEVDVEEKEEDCVNSQILDKYKYDPLGVAYQYDKNNPAPHYISTDATDQMAGHQGTFLAGIVAAMKLDDDKKTETYGVAYNAAILPVNRDVVRGLGREAMYAMTTNNADVILVAEGLDSTSDTDGGGAFSAFTKDNQDIYTAKSLESTFGSDAALAYSLLKGDHSTVMVVGNGSHQTQYMDRTQPLIQSVVPLLRLSDSDLPTKWKLGSVLPNLASTNPFYHLYITVGSIDELTYDETKREYRATPSTYSQPCGIAGSYCVMASGGRYGTQYGGILSTLDPTLVNSTDGYAYAWNYGTSAAAASVAGSVAVLMGAYPHLTPQQVVEILFKTATYIEPTEAQRESYGPSYGVGQDTLGLYNSIFGRGLINLAAATQPVGGKDGLWVYDSRFGNAIGKSKGVVHTVAMTHLMTPATMSVGGALSSVLPDNFVAFDLYNRPFALPTAGLFTFKNRRKTKSLDDFKLFMRGRDPVTIQATDDFSMMYRQQTQRVSSSSQIPMGLFQMNLKQGNMRYGLSYSQDTTLGKEAYWKRRLVNPFIQMRDAYGVDTAYDFNNKWSVEVGWTLGKNGFFDEDDRHFEAPDNKMQAFTSAVVFKPIDTLSFKVATGVMKETGSSLGMVSDGAFHIKGAKTHFVGAGVAFTPMDKVRLEAMYYYGQTRTSADGGLMSLSRLTSDAFAVTASYQPTEDHLLGLQVSSPLRVKKGTLNVALPVGRHPTEDIYYYDTYQASMKPSAREWDLSMYYQGNLSDQVSVQGEMGVRLNPDHQAEVAPDYRGMVGLKWNY